MKLGAVLLISPYLVNEGYALILTVFILRYCKLVENFLFIENFLLVAKGFCHKVSWKQRRLKCDSIKSRLWSIFANSGQLRGKLSFCVGLKEKLPPCISLFLSVEWLISLLS